ncbi:hypothetical protein AGABI1DRAFT_42398 [Agaricus bisporus var. burnettii JB137-S8]|uniref:Major facilitator superfamily (MFS) profile domain-containing protein n=1 Tax=Agaricus bisporus var. burnettii (strain JB137-S8 / ATCC MYA-4627 / FGSC 10392) TaxID=597362 RepID=K5VU97_AGABU|nr:uncharacterized protein AGABI1DRAFT_42398 [Agaricus bisporus var. burnettii JB137-S8]EKM78039.1 hypothetical protein AGABI1DRAFT_42398 [Agaricus bisporus var. burnettii JB137-S8]
MHIDPQDYEEHSSHKEKATPLPKMQIFIIMLVMLAEPISSTVIYPFVNQFVRDTGITGGDERKVGHYAGFIESAFFLAECTTVFHWGRLSDRIGRRPVLLLGPIGLAASLFTFGFSNSFWTLLIARCAQGAFNGNIGVTKTMVTEITDSTNIAQAYAWLPVMWSSGITLGPLIGGLFAQPARRWPQLSNIKFLVHHPYFLPCAIAGMLALTSFLMAYMGLKEVSKFRTSKSCRLIFLANLFYDYSSGEESPLLSNDLPRKYGSHPTEDSSSEISTLAPIEKEIPLKDLLTRPLLIALANHAFLAFLDQAHQAILPLMYSTSISLGGLSLRPRDIGLVMGVWGAFNAVLQIVFFSRIMKWLGPRTMYITCFSALLVTFSAFPVLNMLSKTTGSTNAMVWITICFQMTFYVAVFMGYGSIFMYVTASAPNKRSLGATNGLSQMTVSIARAIGPALSTSLFSYSVQKNILGGYGVYLCMTVLSLLGLLLAVRLPEHVWEEKEV